MRWMIGSGLCASLVGIGLARFAYTPLIPVLIAAGWFTPGEAMQLGAANFVGYIGGAMIATPLAARLPARWVLRLAMLLASLTFFACAAPVSLVWYAGWRVAAGVAGGVCMALAAPTVLPHVPAARRGLAGGLVFTGVGLGIAASGTIVPALLGAGPAATWMALGGIALLLTAFAWSGWPAGVTAAPAAPAAAPQRAGVGARVWALHASYGLAAFGLVPHMVFLVDFVARGLGRGMGAGSWQWILFGIGAVAGPTVTGAIADRIGFRATFRAALAIQAVALAIPALTDQMVALSVASLISGAFAIGVVGVVLGRLRDLTPPDETLRRAAWSVATMAFAVGQSAGAYALAVLYALTPHYPLLFGIGVAATLLAFVIDLAAGRSERTD